MSIENVEDLITDILGVPDDAIADAKWWFDITSTFAAAIRIAKNILVINAFPNGPLASLVKKIHTPKLSPFKQSSPCFPIENCVYAIYKIDNSCELMIPDDIPNLFGYLIENGYKIDTSITKMMNTSDIKTTNKLLCYISLIN